jgi:hypothetical protein
MAMRRVLAGEVQLALEVRLGELHSAESCGCRDAPAVASEREERRPGGS